MSDFDLSNIWRGWLIILAKDKTRKGIKFNEAQMSVPIKNKRAEQFATLQFLQKRYPELAAGQPGFSLSDKRRLTLVKLIHKESPSDYKYKERMHYLIRGLLYGNEIGLWNINPPAPPMMVKRHASIITPLAMAERYRLSIMKTEFLNSLENIDSLDTEEKAGQLIFSAIVFGGILNRKKLISWCESIFKGIQMTKDACWIRLSCPADSKNALPQTWFADPMTEGILNHWLQTDGGYLPGFNGRYASRPSDAWSLITKFLRRIMPTDFVHPKSCSELMGIAKSGIMLEITPMLIEYGTGLHSSTSLSPQSWLRLRQDCILLGTSDHSQASVKYVKKIQASTFPEKTLPARNQKMLWTEINKYVSPPEGHRLNKTSKPKRAEQLQTWIASNSEKMRPITFYAANWALYMMTKGGQIKKNLSPGAMKTYLSKISRLREISDFHNIPDLEEDELFSIYERFVVQLKGLKDPGQNCDCLRYFHDFLLWQYFAPEIDFTMIDGFISQTHGVDANLITANEFTRLKTILEHQIKSGSDRTKTIQLIIVILGFRCGLRASEARKLRIMDFCNSTQKPELFIRNNAFSRLKTSNGVRQIPLLPFLEKGELQLIKKWHRKRLGESLGDLELPFFTDSADSQTPISAHNIFPEINEIMRNMTGDNSLHFHHLRHSFANWTLLRLIAPDYPQILESEIALPQGVSSDRSLSISITSDRHPGTKMLYALARLMGHASPDETLFSYIHLLDWILAKALQRISPSLSKTALEKIYGVSKTTIHRNQSPDGTLKPENFNRSIRAKLKPQYADPLEEECQKPKPLRQSDIDKILGDTAHKHSDLNMWEFMKLHHKDGLQWDVISQRYNVDIDALESWWEAASIVAEIRTRHTLKCKPTFYRLTGDRWGTIRTIRPTTIKEKLATRHHLIPYLHGRKETDKAIHFLSTLESLPRKHSKLVNSCVLDFIMRAPAEGSELRFFDKKNAKKYMKFLDLLGVSKGRIRAVHYTRPNIETQEQEQQQQWWIDQLGMDRSQIIRRDKLAIRLSGKYGWIGIVVRHWDEKKRLQNMKKSEKKMRRISDHGLKFAIHTYAIRLIINDPSIVKCLLEN